MAAGSVRLPELRQDIKINTSDLTRARRVAKGFKEAMERDLDIDTSKVGANFQTLKNRLEKFREATSGLSDDMASLRKDFERISNDLDSFGKKFDEAGTKVGGLQEKLAELRDTGTINIGIDVDDAELDALRAKLDALRDETIEVKVNVDQSQLESALQAVNGLRNALGSSFNVDTSQWMSQMDEVRNTLQGIKTDTDNLYQSAINLGAAMKLARDHTEKLKDELIALQAVAAKGVNIKVDLDERSVALARARLQNAFDEETIKVKVDLDQDSVAATVAAIQAAFGNQTVTITVDVDTSALDGAAAKVRAMADNIQSSFNVDTRKWTEQTQRVLTRLEELKTVSRDLMKAQQELATAFQLARARAEALKDEIIALQAVAAKKINIKIDIDSDSITAARAKIDAAFRDQAVNIRVDIDDDSLVAARAKLAAAFGDETVTIKVDVDTSALDGIQSKIAAMKKSLTSALTINTSKWNTDVDGVIAKLDQLGQATEALVGSQEALGLRMRETRRDISALGETIDLLELSLDGMYNRLHDISGVDLSNTIRQMKDLGDTARNTMSNTNGMELANQKVAASYEEMSRRGKRSVDELQSAMSGLEGVSAAIQQAFNIDTSAWKEQVQDVTSILQELRDATNGLKDDADDLGGTMRDQRNEIATSDAQWQDLLETLHRIEGRFDTLGEAIGRTSSITQTFAVRTSDSMGSAERSFTALERAHGRVAKAAADMAKAEHLAVEATQKAEIAARKLFDINDEYIQQQDVLTTADERLSAGRAELAQATQLVTDREGILNLVRDKSMNARIVLDAERQLREARDRLAVATAALSVLENERETVAARLASIETGAIGVTNQLTNAVNAKSRADGDAGAASERHARATEELGNAANYASDPVDKLSNSFNNTNSSGMNLHRTLRTLRTAFMALSVVGLIVPGIGLLGGAFVGLLAAASDLVPALLLLPALITSVGVAAGGLFAIFKNNKGLEQPIKELGEAFKGIQEDLQNRVNPSIKAFLKEVEGLAPIVKKQVPAFADAFNEIAKSFTQYIGSEGFMKDLDSILAQGVTQFKNWGLAVRSTFESFVGLAEAGQSSMTALSASVANGAEQFRVWVAEARRTGELEQMWQRMVAVLQSVGRTVGNLIVSFKNLFDISTVSGFTDAVLNTLEGITADFREFTVTNRAALTAMFDNLRDQVLALRPLMASVADGIRIILTNVDLRPIMDGLQQVMQNFAEGATEAANAIGRLVQQAAPAINSLITLIRGIIPDIEKIGTAFLQAVKPVIDSVQPAIERLGEAISRIAEDVLPVLSRGFSLVAGAVGTIVTILAPIAEVIGKIVGALGGMNGVLGDLISTFIALRVGQAVFQGIGRYANDANRQVGLMGRVVGSLAQPFAAAATGAKNLATSTREVVRGNTDMANSNSGVLRTFSSMREAYTTTAAAGRASYQQQQQAAQTMGTATAGVLGRMASDLNSNADRHRQLASVAQSSGNQVGAAYNQAAGAVTGAMGSLTGALNNVGSGMTRLGTTARAAGAAITTGLGNAVRGVGDALGGKWGIAVTAAITALGLFSQASQKAKAEQDELRKALADGGGEFGKQEADILKAKLASEGYGEAIRDAGLSVDEIVAALMKGGPEWDAMRQRIDDVAASGGGIPDMGAKIIDTFTGQATSAQGLGTRLDDMRGSITGAEADMGTFADTAGNVPTPLSEAQQRAGDLSNAFRTLRDSTGDADERVKILQRTLDGFGNSTLDVQGKQKELNDAIRDVTQGMEGMDGSLQMVNGQLDTSTEKGSAFFDSVTDIAKAAMDSAIAVSDDAKAHGDLAGASAKSRAEIQKARDAVVAAGKAMGLSSVDANKLADQMGLIPEQVDIAINSNAGDAQKQMEMVKQRIDDIPLDTVLNVSVPLAPEVIQKLRDMGVEVREIPGANGTPARIELELHDEETRRRVGDLHNWIPNAGGAPPQITPGLQPGPAQQQAQELHQFIPGAGGAPPVIIPGLDPGPAQQGAQDLHTFIPMPGGLPPVITPQLQPGPARADAATLNQDIPTAGGGPPVVIPGLQGDPALGDAGTLNRNIPEAGGGPPQITPQLNDADLRGALPGLFALITAPAGGPPKLPVSVNFDEFNGLYGAKRSEILADRSWLIPMGINFDAFTADYEAKRGDIEGGAAWLVPMGVSWDRDFTPQYEAKRSAIEGGTAWLVPMTTEWERYFTPAYVAKRDSIFNGAAWLVPMTTEWDRYFTPQYEAKRSSIENGAAWRIPMSLDLTEVDRQYRELVRIITQPLTIPVSIQFSFGGLGMAAAAGGIIANQTGNIVASQQQAAEKAIQKFAKGGVSQKTKRDLLNMGDAYKAYAPGGIDDQLNQRMAQNGLTPMNANRAQIVPPNSWRIIGDRAQDDEAYIPINKSARSMAILAETMNRMGVQAQRMANGGFSPTTSATNTADGNGKTTTANSQVINNQSDAPMINGDLVITVPSETPVQDSMDEVLFQLRRIKRGGVHVRSAMRSK